MVPEDLVRRKLTLQSLLFDARPLRLTLPLGAKNTGSDPTLALNSLNAAPLL